MDPFEKKTLKTSRGYTYTYYTAEGDKSLPTLLFQHGCPDHAEMWVEVATQLRSTKHPIIIPDLLGYDGTDKPTDPAEYKWDAMTKDLIEIIDTEKADKFISIGHDWGSVCASRMYNYYPGRVVGLVNISIAYVPPSREPFDLDAVNEMAEQGFGYPIYTYWNFFIAKDGPVVLKENLERLYNVLHGKGDTMRQVLCAPNGLRNVLTNGGPDIPMRSYAQKPELKQAFIDRMSRDGFEGPLCWYLAITGQKQTECDKDLPEGADKVNVPTLYIGAKDDAVGRPEAMYPYIQAGLLPHLEQADMIDAGHWVTNEAPEEVVSKLESWLKAHFAK
jgi:soluble epoxide hydrolase/lipid-phosphate phosphatase